MTRSAEYEAYIRSPEWRKRSSQYRMWGTKCEVCFRPARVKMHVHHLHYRNLGNEKNEDLALVCPGCHDTIHTLAHTENISAAEATVRAMELPVRGGRTLAEPGRPQSSVLRIKGDAPLPAPQKGLAKRIVAKSKPKRKCPRCKRELLLGAFMYPVRGAVPSVAHSKVCGRCRSSRKKKRKPQAS